MLEQGSWLPQAMALPTGRRARVDHNCGPGRTLLIRSNEDGSFNAHCFRCSESGYHRPTPDFAALVQRSRDLGRADADLQRSAAGGCGLPEPAEYAVDSWPPAARLWLYRSGFGRAEIAKLGIYYHAPTDRVILPLLDSGGRPRHWQGRAYQTARQPKYLGPGYRDPAFIPIFGKALAVRGKVRPVLTEDILSAAKIGLAGFEAWPILGTSIPAAYIAELMRRGGAVLWLDPDPAGQRACHKYTVQLKAYGIPVRIILSAKDPKRHHVAEIQEYLR